MAGSKISDLPAAVSVADSDLLVIVSGGDDYKATRQQILNSSGDLAVYGVGTVGDTDYERLRGFWNSSDSTYRIATEAGGTGTARALVLSSGVSGGTIVVGKGEASASPGATILRGANASGANVAGPAFTIAPGQSTGTAASGLFSIKTSPAGGAGMSLNAYVTALSIDSNQRFGISGSIVSAQRCTVYQTVTTDKALVVRSAASGTGNLIECQASDGTTIITSIGAKGAIVQAPLASSGTPSTTGAWFNQAAATFTDSNTAGSGTTASAAFVSLQQSTLAATNAGVTTTHAATLYIAGGPAAGTNETISNSWGLWNAGSARVDGTLAVGTATPSSIAHVANTTTSATRGVVSSQHNGGTHPAYLNLQKSRGTNASPTIITTGDGLGAVSAWGHDGVNYLEMGRVDFISTGTVAATRVPTKLVFSTATDAAPSVLTTALTINSDQKIYIGNGITSAAPTAGFIGGTGASGADTAGAAFTMAPGPGTGTGLCGTLLFKIAPVGSTGSALNSLTTVGTFTAQGQFKLTPFNFSATPSLSNGFVDVATATYTDSGTAGSGTLASAAFVSIQQPTLAATNSGVTTTHAATLYIAGGPTAGSNETITNSWGLWNVGKSRFDNTIGVKTVSPSGDAHVASTSTSTPRGIVSSQHSAGTHAAYINLQKSRGTNASPTVITTGDLLGSFAAWGYDGTNYLEMGRIDVTSTGTIASTRVPTKMSFSTATDAAPSVLTTAMTIDASQNIGVGTATPLSLVHAATASTATPRGIVVSQHNGGTHAAYINLYKSRGTNASPTVVTTGDSLGSFAAWGYDGSNYLEMARIDAVSMGTIAATRVPTKLVFSTATDAAPSVLTTALTIDSSQRAGFGTTAPATTLQVATSATTTPRGITVSQHNGGNHAAYLNLYKSRGTNGSPTVITTGDTLGSFAACGYDGSNYLEMGRIDVVSTGTIAATRVPTKLVFSTATNAVPSVLTTALTINSDQKLYVGNGITSATPVAGFIGATGASGADANGASLTVASGPSTGTGLPGAINFQLSSIGTTGSALNALSTVATFNSNGQFKYTPLDVTATPSLSNGFFDIATATYTDNATAGSGTIASVAFVSIQAPTLAAENASVTTTNAATLYISGDPIQGTNETIVNGWGFWNAGKTKFDDKVVVAAPGYLSYEGLSGQGAALRWSEEEIVLNTGGTTTDSSSNLLPANSLIRGVVARVTDDIVTATSWAVGDASVAARFMSANSTLTNGTTSVGFNHWKGSVSTATAGPTQTSDAPVRITTVGTPSAGTIRICVFYEQYTPPTA